MGYKFERGSTPYFTIALVVFATSDDARRCQAMLEDLRAELKVPADYEFHFHEDGHQRRLEVLSVVARCEFRCHTFTLDKRSPMLTRQAFRARASAYKWVCQLALENVDDDLEDATVVLDGSGDRDFRREMQAHLRHQLNSGETERVRRVKIGRSQSDLLLQLADYVASATNRLFEGKPGAEVYDQYLRRKRRSQRMWP